MDEPASLGLSCQACLRPPTHVLHTACPAAEGLCVCLRLTRGSCPDLLWYPYACESTTIYTHPPWLHVHGALSPAFLRRLPCSIRSPSHVITTAIQRPYIYHYPTSPPPSYGTSITARSLMHHSSPPSPLPPPHRHTRMLCPTQTKQTARSHGARCTCEARPREGPFLVTL
jgi:hypothetical protein